MIKNIILVRHAKSDWSVAGQRDFDRTLNDRGHMDAPRMGIKFKDRGIMPDILISSPALRAKLTAEYFAEQLKYDFEKIVWNEDIYDASIRVLLNEISLFDDNWNTVMIFGHNPGLSYLAEYITKEEIGEIPTCSVMSIEFTIDSWKEVSQGMGKISFYDYPKND